MSSEPHDSLYFRALRLSSEIGEISRVPSLPIASSLRESVLQASGFRPSDKSVFKKQEQQRADNNRVTIRVCGDAPVLTRPEMTQTFE